MAIETVQKCIIDSLQGLAFWVGYQNEVSRHHKLPEGAIVAELRRLINEKVRAGLRVECEVLYSQLINTGYWEKKALADIAITDVSAEEKITLALIEVKRLKSSDHEINMDLIKIGLFKKESPSTRTFLAIIGQARLPEKWVDANGNGRKGVEKIEVHGVKNGQVRYKVLRVLKAASSFESKNSASYCCLIEVI
jgi:hypothetical protein